MYCNKKVSRGGGVIPPSSPTGGVVLRGYPPPVLTRGYLVPHHDLARGYHGVPQSGRIGGTPALVYKVKTLPSVILRMREAIIYFNELCLNIVLHNNVVLPLCIHVKSNNQLVPRIIKVHRN